MVHHRIVMVLWKAQAVSRDLVCKCSLHVRQVAVRTTIQVLV